MRFLNSFFPELIEYREKVYSDASVTMITVWLCCSSTTTDRDDNLTLIKAMLYI